MGALRRLDSIERLWCFVANTLARWLPFLRKDLDVAAQRYVDLAISLQAGEDKDRMVECFDRAIARAPNDPALLNTAGQACFDSGRYDDAHRYFRLALDRDYFDSAAIKGLAYTLHALNRTDESVYFYFRYLDRAPNDFEALLNLGSIFHESGQNELAIEYSRRAAQADPAKAGPLHNLAVAHFDLGRFDEAERNIRAALERENDPESLRLLGLILETQQKTSEALQSYLLACDSSRPNSDACQDAARLYNRLGRTTEYLQCAKKALALLEGSDDREAVARAYWDLGWAYYREGEWEKSAEMSRAALDLQPRQAPPRFNLGLALLMMGRPDEARREYRTALRDCRLSELKSDAIEDLQHALQSNPDLPGAQEILDELLAAYAEFDRQRPISARLRSGGSA